MNRKKRTTTRDIAKACFVSQSAVSMILSGRKDIHFAPETIERVKRTAKEMGYEYKARAKRKKTGTNDTIMTGRTGTWIVYSYCIHKPLQRTGRILSEYGGRHGILWCRRRISNCLYGWTRVISMISLWRSPLML